MPTDILMPALSPTMEEGKLSKWLKKEGESGRRKLNQYSRYGAVFLALIQGYAALRAAEVQGFAINPGPLFYVAGLISLVGGTMFLLWLGEQITSRGIGNGTSLIIMAGIVANLPHALVATLELGRTGAISTIFIILFLLMAVAVVFVIVFMERALAHPHTHSSCDEQNTLLFGRAG